MGTVNTDTLGAVNVPDAGHTQGTDTALGTLGTKNPPIDADLAIYRNSASSNALVTSTWTQIKAFLKTYFDTLYSALGHTHNLFAETVIPGDYSISSDDTWETIATSTITFTAATTVQVSAHISFRERNSAAGRLFLRICDADFNLLAVTTASYIADEYLNVSLVGGGAISTSGSVLLQIYDKANNSVYNDTGNGTNGTVMNIIGIVTQ